MCWIDALPANRRRGSFPRCLRLTEGGCEEVAARLEKLIGLPHVTINEHDFWMPQGPPVVLDNGQWNMKPIEEARLGNAPKFLSPYQREAIINWWIAYNNNMTNTPNWDIASTCMVDGRKGILLVEAKAHTNELNADGKTLGNNPNEHQIANHHRIGGCFREANRALWNDTRLDWRLSRDSHYQMSNRFAWAWKLTEFGYPVVLVYLGFLNADEMRDRGQPFANHNEWETSVRNHSQTIFPCTAWRQGWTVNNRQLIPLIRSDIIALPECNCPKTDSTTDTVK